MTYTKPQLIAQNASTGSYAAGCPTNNRGNWRQAPAHICRSCEITQ